jgi:hypothetical protein
MKFISISCLLFLFFNHIHAQQTDSVPVNKRNPATRDSLRRARLDRNKRVNFFISTKEKSKKFDLASFTVRLRARIRAFFDRKKMYVVVAKSSDDAEKKVTKIIRRRRKMIANIWFDSHGHYGNRYSSFRLGDEVFSYHNIYDSNATRAFRRIARYCDKETKIGIGACYAGADFYFPATDSTPATRMNGDSLMIGLGSIFKGASIYASESWVMVKTGMFTNKFGLAGYPLQKRFLDSVYLPVWERLGAWNHYSTLTNKITAVSTVSLNRWADIATLERNYRQLDKAKKAVAEKIKKLKPGRARFG